MQFYVAGVACACDAESHNTLSPAAMSSDTDAERLASAEAAEAGPSSATSPPRSAVRVLQRARSPVRRASAAQAVPPDAHACVHTHGCHHRVCL
jgi:hypothetical protein